jgi:hypothetical protein
MRNLLYVLSAAAALSVNLPLAMGQIQADQSVSGAAPDKPLLAQPLDVSGDWRAAWQGRLGTEQCVVHLQMKGTKLTGTFHDLRGTSPLSGTVDANRISFDVQFPGPRPFTIRFSGTADSAKITGTSQAVGVGGAGAYLGHAGEVVQPEHPWTAKRDTDQAAQSREAGSNPNPPARN